eukprot:g2671.t1
MNEGVDARSGRQIRYLVDNRGVHYESLLDMLRAIRRHEAEQGIPHPRELKQRAAEVLQKQFGSDLIPHDAEHAPLDGGESKRNEAAAEGGSGTAANPVQKNAKRVKRTISNFVDKSGAVVPPPFYGETTQEIWRQKQDALSSNNIKHVRAVETLNANKAVVDHHCESAERRRQSPNKRSSVTGPETAKRKKTGGAEANNIKPDDGAQVVPEQKDDESMGVHLPDEVDEEFGRHGPDHAAPSADADPNADPDLLDENSLVEGSEDLAAGSEGRGGNRGNGNGNGNNSHGSNSSGTPRKPTRKFTVIAELRESAPPRRILTCWSKFIAHPFNGEAKKIVSTQSGLWKDYSSYAREIVRKYQELKERLSAKFWDKIEESKRNFAAASNRAEVDGILESGVVPAQLKLPGTGAVDIEGFDGEGGETSNIASSGRAGARPSMPGGPATRNVLTPLKSPRGSGAHFPASVRALSRLAQHNLSAGPLPIPAAFEGWLPTLMAKAMKVPDGGVASAREAGTTSTKTTDGDGADHGTSSTKKVFSYQFNAEDNDYLRHCGEVIGGSVASPFSPSTSTSSAHEETSSSASEQLWHVGGHVNACAVARPVVLTPTQARAAAEDASKQTEHSMFAALAMLPAEYASRRVLEFARTGDAAEIQIWEIGTSSSAFSQRRFTLCHDGGFSRDLAFVRCTNPRSAKGLERRLGLLAVLRGDGRLQIFSLGDDLRGKAPITACAFCPAGGSFVIGDARGVVYYYTLEAAFLPHSVFQANQSPILELLWSRGNAVEIFVRQWRESQIFNLLEGQFQTVLSTGNAGKGAAAAVTSGGAAMPPLGPAAHHVESGNMADHPQLKADYVHPTSTSQQVDAKSRYQIWSNALHGIECGSVCEAPDLGFLTGWSTGDLLWFVQHQPKMKQKPVLMQRWELQKLEAEAAYGTGRTAPPAPHAGSSTSVLPPILKLPPVAAGGAGNGNDDKHNSEHRDVPDINAAVGVEHDDVVEAETRQAQFQPQIGGAENLFGGASSVLASRKKTLAVNEALKNAIIEKHLGLLNYERDKNLSFWACACGRGIWL